MIVFGCLLSASVTIRVACFISQPGFVFLFRDLIALSSRCAQVEDVRQLENVIRDLRETIDRLTSELDEARREVVGQRENERAESEGRIEELEEALRESVRITADRELALDAELQRRNDQRR